MRNQMKKMVALAAAATMTSALFIGCGKDTAETEAVETATEETTAETGETTTAGTYFEKGVYANYSSELENPTKDYFYIFNADTYGYTAQGPEGTGLPFECAQEEGKVTFTFGGADESEEVFNVTEAKDGFIYGYFDGVEDRPLVFEFLADQNPDTFVAENYLSDGDHVYEDANGWKVHYNPDVITVNKGSNEVDFVYTGDCAGTCMVAAIYDVDMNGKEKSEALAKDYGDTATVSETVFPGTEDETCYVVYAPAAEGSVPLYRTALVRDYMDGYLVFEETVTNSGDDAIDIPVSDNLAAIIDSLEFVTYGE